MNSNFIQVYTGPMRCGKSQMLLEQYNRCKIAKKDIIMFKPKLDSRTPQLVADRNGKQVEAIEVKSIKDIYNYILDYKKLYNYNKLPDCIFIDEFQFFNDSVEPILKISDFGIKVYIAGLNLSADRKPFGSMNNLLCIATNVDILTAVCEHCYKSDALYTFCNEKRNNGILIGDEQYIPVCGKCWNILNKK